MTRDHLLGFPPVLLAQDDQMPCSNEGLHFPLGIPESAYHDYKSRPEYKRTRELMAFEMLPARPEITEADCRQAKPSADAWRVPSQTIADATWAASGSVTVCVYDVGSNEPVTVPQPTPPGVWRKTAEHKPPVGSEHLTRYTGAGCERAPDVRRLVWSGEVWREGAVNVGSEVMRDWLDTSGEFKVGDRVRVKDGVESIYCKPGMVGTVKRAGRSVWFRADGEDTDFCTTDWLERA